MKYTLIVLLLAASCKQTQQVGLSAYSRNISVGSRLLYDSSIGTSGVTIGAGATPLYIAHNDTATNPLCKERGHAFGVIERGGLLIANGEYYFPEQQIVDAPDSSYVVQIVPGYFKFCDRCEMKVRFPQKPKYIKTIWRREK